MTDIVIHHKFSPSALQQYSLCPAAWAMQMGLPDVKTPESIEGTKLHAAVVSGDFAELDSEQIQAVEYCQQFKADEVAEVLGEEMRLNVCDEEGNELCFGYIDLAFRDKDGTLCGVDWKFGRRAVPELPANFQTATYAVALMQKYGENRCKFWLAQPRLGRKESYVYMRKEAILSNIKMIIFRCEDKGKMEFNPGEVCRYCRAKANCPAYQRCFQRLINTALTDATDTQIAELFDQCKMAERFAKEVKDALDKRIKENGDCAGWHYVEKPGNREIKDIAGVYQTVKDAVTPEELFAQCKVSVPGVIDLLAGKVIAQKTAIGEKCTQKAAKAEVETQLAEFITRGRSTRTLVRGNEE